MRMYVKVAASVALPPSFPVCLQTDKATVNGPHDASTLQGLINGFIAKFVLCPKCSLPETDLVRARLLRTCARPLSPSLLPTPPLQIVKPKSGTIMHKCAACGHKVSSFFRCCLSRASLHTLLSLFRAPLT